MSLRNRFFFGLVGLSLLIGSSALADVAPPGKFECDGKKPGDACQLEYDKQAGTCVASTCTSSSRPLPDGRIVGGGTYDCLLCTVTKTGGDGTKPAADGSVKVTTEKESGCTVGGLSAGRAFGPWILALSVSLIFFFGFRRRR